MKDTNYNYIVYTDGGCLCNPGGAGACASVIIDTETGESQEIVHGYRSTTNNRMELRAVIQALDLIPDTASVCIHSDSQYVINCASGTWGKKKNHDLWRDFESVSCEKSVDFVWVKGHNNDPLNERCDKLCTQKMAAPDLLVDHGYNELDGHSAYKGSRSGTDRSDFAKKYPGGALGVDITPDGDIPLFFDKGKSERRAKDTCQKAISAINKQAQPSFKVYMSLKTGGIDQWSKAPREELRSLCGDKTFEYITSFFDDESHQLSAVKWYVRGLSIDKAIRRELVSMEVESNMVNCR